MRGLRGADMVLAAEDADRGMAAMSERLGEEGGEIHLPTPPAGS